MGSASDGQESERMEAGETERRSLSVFLGDFWVLLGSLVSFLLVVLIGFWIGLSSK